MRLIRPEMFETWLIAWLLGIAAVAGVVAAAWTVATYRELKREGASHAGRIVARLWFSPIAWLLRIGDSAAPGPGGLAWVWWDLRWGPSGQTAATIGRADGTALHLSLARPIEFYSATGALLQVTDVRFVPSNHTSYRWGTAAGVLQPFGSAEWQRAPGACPSARLCVLESSTA